MQPEIRLISSFEGIFSFLKERNYSQLFVLCDENTAHAAWPILQKEFEKENFPFELLMVAAGERSKDWKVCLQLWEKLSENQADRNSVLLNLGGGMITDLGAFVASVYKRGIDFVHLPTSLLAMTDAAIGGKCGIDFLHYKNQLGLFAAAQAIWAYPPFLKTLPAKELKSGFAEVLKHALIADKEYWQQLKAINLKSDEISTDLLAQSIRIKTDIVNEDPLEKRNRKKLNFGHTVGHALESFFLEKQTPIPHGYGVAAGIWIEAYLSIQYTQLGEREFEEIAENIQGIYPALNFVDHNIDEILSFLSQDKKAVRGNNQFTLLNAIGEAKINVKVEEKDIRAALTFYLSRNGK